MPLDEDVRTSIIADEFLRSISRPELVALLVQVRAQAQFLRQTVVQQASFSKAQIVTRCDQVAVALRDSLRALGDGRNDDLT